MKVYQNAKILNRFNDGPSSDKDEVPEDLYNSKIINIGKISLPDDKRVEGGLCIDYIPQNSDEIKRLLLGYNDLGMWIVFNKKKSKAKER